MRSMAASLCVFALVLLMSDTTEAFPHKTDNCPWTTFVNCNVTKCNSDFVECDATDTLKEHCVCGRARLHLENELDACTYKQKYLSDVTYFQVFLGEWGAAEFNIGNTAMGAGQIVLTLAGFCILSAVAGICAKQEGAEWCAGLFAC